MFSIKTYKVLFITAATLFGLSISLVAPLMGLYLIDEIGMSPMLMGIVLALQVVVSTLASSQVGRISDAGASRRKIMMICQQFLVAALVIFILSRNVWVISLTAIGLFALAFPSMSQIYSLAREYCDRQPEINADLFMSVMRAGFAVAFVIGPPLAFFIKQQISFNLVFMVALVIAELMVLVVWFLPNLQAQAHGVEDQPKIQWYRNRAVSLVLLCSLLAFAANTLFTVSLPLYLTKELLLDAQWAGTILGLAALLEIPLMVIAGRYGAQFGYQRAMIFGVLSGIALFIGMLLLTEIRWLLSLQIFNALFVAIMQTLGMLLMQQLMRKQMGLAMALFNNTFSLAMLVSNLTIGIVAQFFSYHAVYWVGLILLLGALLCLMAIKTNSHSQSAATA